MNDSEEIREDKEQRKHWFSPTGKPEPKPILIPFWESIWHFLTGWMRK